MLVGMSTAPQWPSPQQQSHERHERRLLDVGGNRISTEFLLEFLNFLTANFVLIYTLLLLASDLALPPDPEHL